ncbi:DUF2155 domain-containing protein [Marinovum sp. 2_MG-2023]|uniref:DUF2155 domain-containing protein n=1 Tax=unclassified Marinovum TaxID=2647166 RepID=UPI0026E3BA0D|nr:MULTISPECIES: DUF2155 domain-containing protein [unclassified Marinovum]MDO6728872.1 DUF2155 domain-containing protein [Marinovum sp. 2_MG-2023]MDO6777712.1 DUF2155 domain-containing protein [Marinovum sp. 1_MG-2023]
MKRAFLWAILTCAAASAMAQEAVSRGNGAVLRGLDKVSGDVTDFELSNGGLANFGNLRIDLTECRYPEGNPAGDAFAFLNIWEKGASQPMFSGWMIASSPALNALDHSRYDVWVLRCRTS